MSYKKTKLNSYLKTKMGGKQKVKMSDLPSSLVILLPQSVPQWVLTVTHISIKQTSIWKRFH